MNTNQETQQAVPWAHLQQLDEYQIPSFPINALSEPLRSYVMAVAVASQTPEDMAALISLSVVAAANAKNYIIRFADDWVEPLNLYILVAMEPGNRKSMVFGEGTKPLAEFERAQVAELAMAIAESLSRKKILEERVKNLQKKLAAPGENTDHCADKRALDDALHDLATLPMVVSPQYIADDVTPEHLSSLLCEQKGKMAVMSAEGTLFNVIVGGMYSKIPNIDVLLKAHAGDSIRVGRKGREDEFIENPALTIGLAIQPDVITGLAGKPGLKGRGLLARFLYSLPASTVGNRAISPPAVEPQLRQQYYAIVQRLLEAEQIREENGGNPLELRVSIPAGNLFNRYRHAVEVKMRPFGEYSTMKDWAAKLCGAVLRIAGNLHLVENHRADLRRVPEISVETMQQAIDLGDYFSQHALAAYGLMGADKTLEMAKEVWAFIESRELGTFTRRDVHTSLRGRTNFQKAESLIAPLALLVERGYIRPVGGRRDTGRPSDLYETRPELLNPHQVVAAVNEADLEYRPPSAAVAEDDEDEALLAQTGESLLD